MRESLRLAKQRHSPEESAGRAVSFALPEYLESRVYLGVYKVKFKNTFQAAKPTNVLDVRGQVWVCLDDGKGRRYLSEKHKLPRVEFQG